MRFVGKKVLVTSVGCNAIGRMLATAFAGEGADIAIHYHCGPEIAAEVIDDLDHAGTRSIALQANLKIPTVARNLVRQAEERLSGLDILVLTAATAMREPDITAENGEWDDSFDIRLRSASICAREAAKLMLKNKTAGRIVMIGSAAQYQVPHKEAPGAFKTHGLLKLARTMALELAPHGITVNVIDPGICATGFNRPLDPISRQAETSILDIPMARPGTPKDIIEPTLFLAGQGAGYVTGNAIFCDGGVVLRQLPPENFREELIDIVI